MKKGILTLVVLIAVISSKATTYYSVANGSWGGSIWSSVCSTCAGGTLPALAANDVIIIDNQVTISSGTQTIIPTVTIIIRTDFSPNTSTNPAALIFSNGGKLVLTSSGSKVVLENVTGNSANDPRIDGSGNGGSNIIEIGSVEYWRASDGDISGVGTLQPNGTLPITLTGLQASQAGQIITLTWSTASEENFDRFIIEHATDGLHFDSIGFVSGAGNSKQFLNYTFDDSNPILGKNYYRLKSVDFDLAFEYSDVVLADFNGERTVSVYPNPTKGNAINIRTNFTPAAGDRVELYDNLGLKIGEYLVNNVAIALQFQSTLKRGSYLLRYVSTDFKQVIRITAN
jgi:hypothetical protein